MTPDSGASFPGWFIALFVIFVLLGVGGTVWRIFTARKIASDAGLDPNKAGAISLLSPDGVGATYLASTLASRPSPDAQGRPDSPKTVEHRLLELQTLMEKGLLSDQEFQAQRQNILKAI